MNQVAGYEVLEELYVGSRYVTRRAVRSKDGHPVILKMPIVADPPADRLQFERNTHRGATAPTSSW